MSFGTRAALWFIQMVMYAGGIVVSTGLFTWIVFSKHWGELSTQEQFGLAIIFVVVITTFVTLVMKLIKRNITSEAKSLADRMK